MPLQSSTRHALQHLADRMLPGYRFRPDRYWERRANELIATYDMPETWGEKRWLRSGAEEEAVPRLLREAGAHRVLVAGAGCGREYGYLHTHDFELCGFDISATMVAECRRRFPEIRTVVSDVRGVAAQFDEVDAVVTSGVLTVVPPSQIEAATSALKQLAARLVVSREKTVVAERSNYQWAHDYDALFAEWRSVHRETTDEDETMRAELMAWRPPPS